jgi:hypothetical protein
MISVFFHGSSLVKRKFVAVVNAANEPVSKATVKALKAAYKDGERSLQAVQSAPTNDLGE